MKLKFLVPLLLFQAGSLAAQGASESIQSQIFGGFTEILAGSLGLKIVILILVIAAAAVGYWKGATGGL